MLPSASKQCQGDPHAAPPGKFEIGRSGYVLILTRGHLHDRTVLMQTLRTEAGYIGMICSRRKREQLLHSLLKEGFSAADWNRVHSPIGIDIGAEVARRSR